MVDNTNSPQFHAHYVAISVSYYVIVSMCLMNLHLQDRYFNFKFKLKKIRHYYNITILDYKYNN